MLMQQYEMFTMNKDESINSMTARFSNITNELENLGRKCNTEDKVRKLLRSLDDRWQSKVTAIEEAKDLSTLTFQDLVGSLMAYELSLHKPRTGESNKGKGIALKSSSADSDDEEVDEGMGLFVKRFNNAFNMKPSKPQSNKNFKRFKPKSKTKGCFKCGESDHMIKDCPTWKNIKSKEKRERTKHDYKQAMLAACGWGDLEIPIDSESEAEEEEEEPKANVCLSSNNGTKSKGKQKDLCLMSNPEDSDSDEEQEVCFADLKDKFCKWSKVKLVDFLEQVYNVSEERKDSLNEMHKQILDIAEENHFLKETVTDLKSKRKKDSNPKKVTTTSPEVTITSPEVTITSDLKEQIETLTMQNSNLIEELVKKNSELTTVEYSYQKKIIELQERLNQPKDECENCKKLEIERNKITIELDELQVELDRSKGVKECTNCENLEKEKFELQEKLKEAFNVSQKWNASETVLKFLNEQSKRLLNEGIGYQTKRRKEYVKNNSDPSKRDFRKRKYVGLPEYIICYYCGKTGHVQQGCEKRKNDRKRSKEYASKQPEKDETLKVNTTTSNNKTQPINKKRSFKQVWVRKDSLPKQPNKKGPNLVWVPKSK